MNEASSKSFKQEIHLRDYLIVLDRYKWLIIAAMVITVSSTALYLKRQVPVYQAQAKIIIEEPRLAQETLLPQTIQVVGSDWLYLETQLSIITTTPVLASAVKNLGLTTAPEGTAEFAAEIAKIRGSIRVNLLKDTRMVIITATHLNSEKATAIANAVAQAYIDQDRLSRLQSGRDSIRWLSTQLADLKIKIRNSERTFQEFKEREKMLTLDEKRSEELEEISKLNASYYTARSKRIEIETIINKINSEDSADINIPIAMLDSPNLQKLGSELTQLQTDLSEKRKTFKDTFPEVKELKSRINLTEQKILVELKRQQDFLKAQSQRSFLFHYKGR